MTGPTLPSAVDKAALVHDTVEVADAFFLTRIAVDTAVVQAQPGQFVQLRPRPPDGFSPYLRIPLSVAGVDVAAGTVDVLYEAVGPKTAALSQLRKGDQIGCLGPLGNAFAVRADDAEVLLVGGGIGIPPLLFLGQRLRAAGRRVRLLAGARTASKHLPDEFLQPAAQDHQRATDDGSLGHSGLVTDLLVDALKQGGTPTVCTCGPHGMMAAVARLCAERKVACQASLEEYMACGFGVCVGCVIGQIDGGSRAPYHRYSRVCVDGPVYDAGTIEW